jgi:hypothetical protein
VDNTPPVISSISSGAPLATSTSIVWTTNEAATSRVVYGATTAYGIASSSAALVTSHSIALTGLTASTTYDFQVVSVDAEGNTSTSSNQTFSTANPLAYPSGIAYGFNSNQIAAAGISSNHGFSGIAQPNNFLDILTSATGTQSQFRVPPIYSSDSYVGPYANYSGSVVAEDIWTGNSTSNDTAAVMGAIVELDSSPSDGGIIQSTYTPGTGWWLGYQPDGGSGLYIEGAQPAFTELLLAPNTPYFVAASIQSGNTINAVTVNLNTGVLQTYSGSTTVTSSAPDGTYTVGNKGGDYYPFTGNIATAMWGPSYLTLSQLETWAQNPWQFWYPAAP